jgi:hypothetical protein
LAPYPEPAESNKEKIIKEYINNINFLWLNDLYYDYKIDDYDMKFDYNFLQNRTVHVGA